MLVLHCADNVFKTIGHKPRTVETSPSRSTFGEWYVARVEFVDTDDLMACMHCRSRYLLLVPLDGQRTTEQLMATLQARLLKRLIDLETPPEAAHRVLATYQQTGVLSKATDRTLATWMRKAMKSMEYGLEVWPLWHEEGTAPTFQYFEHHNNTTNATIAGRRIEPLAALWECVRDVCPDLPARTLNNFIRHVHESIPIEGVRTALLDHMPEPLAKKFFDTFCEVEALFTVEELHTFAEAFISSLRLRQAMWCEHNRVGILRRLRNQLKIMQAQ